MQRKLLPVYLAAAVMLSQPPSASAARPIQGSDSCSQPTPITAPGTYLFDTTSATTSGFSGGGACGGTSTSMRKDLFWSLTIPTDGHYRFDTMGSTFDTTLSVHAGPGCSATCLEHNDNFFWLNSELLVLRLEAGDEVLVQVGGYTDDEFGAGQLRIQRQPDTCQGILEPDYLEDFTYRYENDTCAMALPLGDGFYPNLNAAFTDLDYYALELPPGARLEIYLDEALTGFDILRPILWDRDITCEHGPAWQFSQNVGDISTDSYIEYTNTTSAPLDLALHVQCMAPNGCQSYDLTIVGTGRPFTGVPVGDNYCTSIPNSTGVRGKISAFGSVTVQDNLLTLFAKDLPTLSFGYFIVSPNQGFTPNPGGSQGNLCLGIPVGRYVGPGEVQNSGLAGVAELAVDLTAIPQPQGFVAATAGDSFHFQFWSRDTFAGAPTSNFTNGLAVTFQ